MNEIEKLKARLGEIVASLELMPTENFTDEQVASVNSLNDEFTNVKGKIEALEKMEAMKATASASAGRTVNPATPAPASGIKVVNRFEKTGGFKNIGDFALAVKGFNAGNIDKRFSNSTAFEFAGEDGGFLIPEDFLSTIEKKLKGDESLLGRSRQFQTSSNHLGLPVDESQPWNGGVQANWVEEGGQQSESKAVLGKAKFELHKLAILVKATDELLEDASSLSAYISQSAPEAIQYKINNAMISGNGVGKPTGILSSGFKIAVAKESGQTADTIVYKNIVKMESKFLGGNGVYIAHPQVKEQVMQLKDDNGNFLYVSGNQFQSASASPFDTLMGRPVIYMKGSMPALGDEGDIILADMSYYYSVLKRG